MSTSQLPQHPIEAHLSNLGTRWLLVLERTLPNTPQKIWAALTQRELVSRWAPFDPDRDLTETGFVSLPEAGADTSHAEEGAAVEGGGDDVVRHAGSSFVRGRGAVSQGTVPTARFGGVSSRSRSRLPG